MSAAAAYTKDEELPKKQIAKRRPYIAILMEADINLRRANERTAGEWLCEASPFIRSVNEALLGQETDCKIYSMRLARLPRPDSFEPAFHLGLAKQGEEVYIAVIFSGPEDWDLNDDTPKAAISFAKEVYPSIRPSGSSLLRFKI